MVVSVCPVAVVAAPVEDSLSRLKRAAETLHKNKEIV